MSKKISIMIAHLWQGGGERVCVNLANELVNLGYEVELVVFSLEKAVFDKELDDNINLVCLEIYSNRDVFLKMYKYLKNENPSLILSFNYHISFFLSFFSPFFSYRLFSRSLNTLSEEMRNKQSFKDKIKKILIVWGLKQSEKVIAQSIGMMEDLLKFGVSMDKIIVINNPINPHMLTENTTTEKGDYILFVGRLSEQKGLHYLLKAMSKMKNNLKLYIVGKGVLKEELIGHVNSLELGNRVVFLGHKYNVKEYYQRASCTVLSSLYEGFPNVLVESIACGTPVVSFDCPNGPSEIIIDGVNGFLVKYLDVEDLAIKIDQSLSYNFDITQLKETVRQFHPTVIVKKYLEVFYGNE